MAIDRQAVILYKRALDQAIAADLMAQGLDEETAREEAATYSVPVYSPNQEDEKPAEDPYIHSIRKDLVRYRLADDEKDGPTEKAIKRAFKVRGQPPWILIVCSKLLTGFDAPAESVMYLDSPLKEHNLLQAIARTNRVDDHKKDYGLILDYVGVTRYLDEALASYRTEDVQNAMTDLDGKRSELRQAHADAMGMVREIKRKLEYSSRADYETEFYACIKALGTEDEWLRFKRKAKIFIRRYAGLTPDPFVLQYQKDCKWTGLFLLRGSQHFEHEEEVSLQNASAKIREMLGQELRVTGMIDLVKIRSIVDEGFDDDFDVTGKAEAELQRAAVRKATELKKTLSEKIKDNPEQYRSLSEQLMAILDRMREGQMDVAESLRAMEEWRDSLVAETRAHEDLGLTATAYGVFRLLEGLANKATQGLPETCSAPAEGDLTVLHVAARDIDALYASPATAPRGWQRKDELKKDLRRLVKRVLPKIKYPAWKEAVEKVEDYALGHCTGEP